MMKLGHKALAGAAICAAVNDEDPLDWPTISGQPINEFQTEGLCSIAFPTLFPYDLSI